MPKKELKIVSWNVEKLSVISRFNEEQESISRNADIAVLRYLVEEIKIINPDIVCLIELNVATISFITTQLKGLLPDNTWEFNQSLPVSGGGQPVDNVIPSNELYLVISKTESFKVLRSETVQPALLNHEITKQGEGDDSPRRINLLRSPYYLQFIPLAATDGPVLFSLVVVHLQQGRNNSDLEVLAQIPTIRNSTSPVFIAGDFNKQLSSIQSQFMDSYANSHDTLNQIPIPNNSRPRSSALTNLTSIDRDNLPTDILLYRRSRSREKTGPDDIISVHNPNNDPQGPNTGTNPNTGITDLLEAYTTARGTLPLSGPILLLQSIQPVYLIKGEEDFGAALFAIPSDYNGTSLTDKYNVMFNAWARHRGGISDHLPIVMKINIDIP